jgi:CRP-like cAMP-binding protein
LGFTANDWQQRRILMPEAKTPSRVIENHLLAALSSKSYNHLAPLLELVSLTLGKILYSPQVVIPYVYFPHQTVISLVNILKNDAKIEMTIIGSEGMLGTSLLSGDDKSPHRAIVQIADGGMRMKAAAFKKECKENAEFQEMALRYSQALFVQVAQTAACNTLHPIAQRLARWLLMSQDRMGAETFSLTHEFLSIMLGVQRAGVTIAAGKLQKAGIIEYRRGKVTILRRDDLEKATCECYATIKAEIARLLPQYKNN